MTMNTRETASMRSRAVRAGVMENRASSAPLRGSRAHTAIASAARATTRSVPLARSVGSASIKRAHRAGKKITNNRRNCSIAVTFVAQNMASPRSRMSIRGEAATPAAKLNTANRIAAAA